jgi:hypothetical protein
LGPEPSPIFASAGPQPQEPTTMIIPAGL